MAETTPTVQSVPTPVEKKSRFRTFTTNHPRITKIAGVTAVAIVVVAIVAVVKSDSDSDSIENETTEAEAFSPETI